MSFIRAGVIGYPIKHSKSPIIHGHWIAQHGLTGEYKAIEIAPENLQQGVQELIDADYAGFNVTIPHKEAIMNLCEDLNDTARAIGAVNTVVVRNGKLFGMNTDAFGFIQNVRETIPAVDFAKGPIIVLGAGGAARAIAYGLMEAGATQIIVTNRTEDKAKDIAAMNPDIIKTAAWDKRGEILKSAGMLINTTALGMTGKDALEIDLVLLPQEAVVADIVYAPLMTDLLTQAKNRGNEIVTGIGMLLHQARPAFEQWFGVMPDVTPELEKKVLS